MLRYAVRQAVAIARRLEAIASRLEAIASSHLEAIASRLEAIASRLEAIASSHLEAIASSHLEAMLRSCCWLFFHSPNMLLYAVRLPVHFRELLVPPLSECTDIVIEQA